MRIDEVVFRSAINDLIKLCKLELGLNDLPPIEFISDPITGSADQPSFGEFRGDTIIVVTKGRHLIDIARTLSHELVHWKQMVDGNELDGSDGSSIENEANAIAGVILRKFGKKYPQYFVDTLP